MFTIGRDVSITIFMASSLNSGEKLVFSRGNLPNLPRRPILMDGLSGILGAPHSWDKRALPGSRVSALSWPRQTASAFRNGRA
jgi:hypothetical protein